ncbi:MAG: hypothetical protein JXR83_02710, partial [Deltaproteobacteria bacterium]|nr:hypothetical protein [Deltaproteobacteria bacterium]
NQVARLIHLRRVCGQKLRQAIFTPPRAPRSPRSRRSLNRGLGRLLPVNDMIRWTLVLTAAFAAASLASPPLAAQPVPEAASAASQPTADDAVAKPVPWLFWAGVGGGIALFAVAILPMVDFYLLFYELHSVDSMMQAQEGQILCPDGSTSCFRQKFDSIVFAQNIDLGLALSLGLVGFSAVVGSCVWLYPHRE